jgi:hypothetical protein
VHQPYRARIRRWYDGDSPHSPGSVGGVSAPPTVPPDDKDWTWVLSAPCSACRFDAAATTGPDALAEMRRAVETLAAALRRPDARERPQPHMWSPLEYGCHVRDVCRVFGARLGLMRATTDPLFANWDQDATAVAERYWEQDPEAVRRELRDESDRLLADFGTVAGEEWQRPGRRSDGTLFTLDSLARYLSHDAVHHAWDVTEGPAAA